MTKKKKTKKLEEGKCVLLVNADVYTKFLVLYHNTQLEWSGYGPVTHDGNGNYRLEDFYYQSTEDSGAETNLTPEALAEAWMNVEQCVLDSSKVQLAWAHCHPSGGNFWSWTDQIAITKLVKSNGPGVNQISVLFCGKVVARIDSIGLSQSMQVKVDYGEHTADIEKATENELEYRKTRAAKHDAMLKQEEELAVRQKSFLPAPEYTSTDWSKDALPWFLQDHEEDEEEVTYTFTCDMCGEHCKQLSKPVVCISCGIQSCVACRSNRFSNLCTVCEIDAVLVYESVADIGPTGTCHLCDNVKGKPQAGRLFCNECNKIFKGVEGKVGRYC